MQTNKTPPTVFKKPPSTLKKIWLIFEPLFIGLFMGVLAGGGIILFNHLIPTKESEKQQKFAFIAYILFFLSKGLIDTVKNILAWLQFRERQQEKKKNADLK